MAKCAWCGKSGWLLLVNQQGLCKQCEQIIGLDVTQRFRIIRESQELVEKSKNLDTKLSRLDLIVEHATELLHYEEKGIHVITPPPSEIIQTTNEKRKELIISYVANKVSDLLHKAQLKTTVNSQVNEATKALLVIRDGRQKLGGTSNELDELEKEVKLFIHRAKLQGYLEAARKAEFKGQIKKALDQYQEALYFLRNDDVNDAIQTEEIAQIEGKIAALKAGG
jgi:cytidylate kinase